MAQHLGVAAEGTKSYGVADRDALHDVRAGVLISGIGASGVGDDGGVELLAEFAAELGDAALGIFGELQGLGAVLHCVHGLARLVLEAVQQALKLLLHLADLLALFFLAFEREVAALAGDLLLAGAQRGALGLKFAQLLVQPIEEAGDVLRLRGQPLARRRDDLRIQPSCCAMLMPADAPGTPRRSS